MRKFRLLLLVAALFAAFLPLLSVVRAQNNPKVLRIAAGDEPAILNWYFSGVGSVSDFMHFYMQPQWGREPDNTIVPLLVDELPSEKNGGLSQTADGKSVIKFKIADWAVWSDGQPIVADDFKLVYDVSTDGISNFLSIWFMNGAKVESVAQGATNKDVVITFAGPHPDWTNAGFEPLPAHILRVPYEAALKNHKGMDTMTDYLRAPIVGDGPYVFAEWKAGQYIRFTRNQKYWKTPYFDEIDANFYPDNKVISQLLVSGDADMSSFLPFLQAVDLVKQNSDKLQLETNFYNTRWELKINQGPKGFAALKDVNVRKAIAMGIDRQAIIDSLYDGKSKVPHSFWDDTPWYNKDTPYIGYDADGAKALLKQAGWYDADGDGVVESHGVKDTPDGTPFVVKASTYSDPAFAEGQNILLAVQDNLGKIGIKINIELYTATIMHSSLTAGSPFANGADDLYVQLWGTGLALGIDQPQYYACDTIPTEKNPSGENGAQVCNPEMDKLWKTLGTSMDATASQTAVNQIQKIMADQVLTLYIANWEKVTVYNKSIQGLMSGNSPTPWIRLADLKRVR